MDEGIETIERKDYFAAAMRMWCFECCSVCPRFRANPFRFDLVEANERVL